MADHSELSSLLVDRDRVDEARLAAALRDLVHIDQATGSLVKTEAFEKLKSREKLLSLLLGRKAAEILELVTDLPVSAKELTEVSGLPKGTVHPALRDLKLSRTVSQDEEGRYFVAPGQVLAAIKSLPQDDA